MPKPKQPGFIRTKDLIQQIPDHLWITFRCNLDSAMTKGQAQEIIRNFCLITGFHPECVLQRLADEDQAEEELAEGPTLH
jgi:hypothetical protein